MRVTLSEALGNFLTHEKYSGWIIAGILAATLLLLVPAFLMVPDQQASQSPGGQVFDLQEEVNRRFPPRIHITSFIVEDREGDILRQKPLWELYRNEQKLRSSELKEFLYNGYDADNDRHIVGVYTIADAVQNLLVLDPRTNATLETATDAQVKEAVSRLLSSPLGKTMREGLSKDASIQRLVERGAEIDRWRASALLTLVVSDNQMLGGGPATISLSGDQVTLGKERFNRRVQEILRGDQTSFRLWGIAIDVNLVSQEQGRTAIPFIIATVVLVLLVVAVVLRSVRLVGLTLLGLVILFAWLKGISNLVGLKSSLTLDLIVPIAMISLGVDFLIHAVSRYQEERAVRPGRMPARALGAGLAGVLGALALAMLSDGIAFLANVTSGIESVIGFGIAAGIAVASSFLIMGIFIPLVLMRWDTFILNRRGSRAGADAESGRRAGPAAPAVLEMSRVRRRIAALVVLLARLRWVVLPLAGAVTVVTSLLAFQLEPKLDVKEFFDAESDLVVSLDKLDQHTALSLAGEPGVVYVKGDLTAPESIAAIDGLLDRLRANDSVGHTRDGEVSLYARTVSNLLSRVTLAEYPRSQVLSATGVRLTDRDNNGIPDTQSEIRAAYDYMAANGIPLNERTLVYDPVQVRETLFHDPAGAREQATVIVFGVLGTREQANVSLAREALERDIVPLRDTPTVSFVGLTGSPFTREATLEATTRALNISLPLAVVACLALLAWWMRSIPFAAATIIPIGLVVSWLYAFMYLAGYHLNFVTATIAAVSIGVGIDYSIHLTQRFREELGRQSNSRSGSQSDSIEALRAAAAGTGVALAGSAASSVIGFAVLSFAPMPMFSTYGILTATMIFLAAGASLLVLPSLLMLVAPRAGAPAAPARRGSGSA